MHLKCLYCNYEYGTRRTFLFHYQMELKDKVSKSACGDESISGFCVGGIVSKIRGTASKCSSSNSSSIFSFIPISSSSSSSSSNPNSNSNPNFNSNTNPISDSNSNSNSDSNGETMVKPYSNLRSSWGRDEVLG